MWQGLLLIMSNISNEPSDLRPLESGREGRGIKTLKSLDVTRHTEGFWGVCWVFWTLGSGVAFVLSYLLDEKSSHWIVSTSHLLITRERKKQGTASSSLPSPSPLVFPRWRFFRLQLLPLPKSSAKQARLLFFGGQKWGRNGGGG